MNPNENDRTHIDPNPDMVSWSPNTITLEGMRIDPGDVVQFLAVLAVSGNVSKSCRVAHISRATIYRMVERIPEFRTAFEDALEQAPDLLEEEAYRRAVVGVVKPVFFAGKVVGAVREYSDRLLSIMLQARHPAYKHTVGSVTATANANAVADAVSIVGPEPPPSLDSIDPATGKVKAGLLTCAKKYAALAEEVLGQSIEEETA